MKIAVIGSNGQLGADVVEEIARAGHDAVPLTHSDIEITHESSSVALLNAIQPNVIVNTAAAHNVAECEKHPDHAFMVNAVGSLNLAVAANKVGAYLMHISTDYVFDGRKDTPYVETDAPAPLNAYGITKLAGEHFIRARCEHYAILRVAAVYGSKPCRAKNGGLNFVGNMLKLADEGKPIRVVADEFTSPTYTRDIANQIIMMIANKQPTGLFHCSSRDQCSWHAFATTIFDIAGKTVSVEKMSIHDTKSGITPPHRVIKRPSYSVMENRALNNIGLDFMPSWKYGLWRYMAEIGKNPRDATLTEMVAEAQRMGLS